MNEPSAFIIAVTTRNHDIFMISDAIQIADLRQALVTAGIDSTRK